jgi:drug/metabolite transporter (DMT)-like permease
MNWFTLSILSVFALASAELIQQHLLNAKNAFSERASAVLTFLFQAILAIPFIFILGLSDQFFSIFNKIVLPPVLLVSFISSISMVFYLRSFKVKNISLSLIFLSSSVIVSTSLGIIFFSESQSLIKFLGIFFILVAIVFLNFKNSILEKNHFWGLLAGSMFGISYTLDKGIVQNIHPFIYIFWTFLFISTWGFIVNSKDVISSIRSKKIKLFTPILISSIGYFLYNLFTFSAYRVGGEVGRVDAINNSEIFLIILFEFFILKHTKGTIRKILSAVLAVLGIVLLKLA